MSERNQRTYRVDGIWRMLGVQANRSVFVQNLGVLANHARVQVVASVHDQSRLRRQNLHADVRFRMKEAAKISVAGLWLFKQLH